MRGLLSLKCNRADVKPLDDSRRQDGNLRTGYQKVAGDLLLAFTVPACAGIPAAAEGVYTTHSLRRLLRSRCDPRRANYYLVASTFHFVPGIPILQSTDLVHWTILVTSSIASPWTALQHGGAIATAKACGRPPSGSTTGFFTSTSPPLMRISSRPRPASPVRGAIPPSSSAQPALKSLSILGRRRQGLSDPFRHRRGPAHPAPHAPDGKHVLDQWKDRRPRSRASPLSKAQAL